LSRIEREAFFVTGLVLIVIPASVEMLSESCFYWCELLSSVTFESGSRLPPIEKEAFIRIGVKIA
jgi:hypothetical protein